MNVPVKSETKQEAETTLTAVESDLKLSIQVIIGLILSLTFFAYGFVLCKYPG